MRGVLGNDRRLDSPEKIFKKALLHKSIIHILLIIIVGLIAYSNTFNVPFQFDDNPNIVENYKLRNLSNFWPPSGSRWFGFYTFALNYYLGGLNTFGYHIANLTIHILNAILIYFLVVLTFKTPYFLNITQNHQGVIARSEATKQSHDFEIASPLARNDNNLLYSSKFTILIALFSALIFVVHPIQTQAVTYIVQRFTSLATFFYLLSLVMYIKFRIHDTRYTIQDKKSKNRESCIMHHASEPKLHATRYTLYAVSLISAILAMKTKEISFTLPFIIALYEFSFFSTPHSEIRIPHLKRLLYLLPFLLTLLIIPLSLIGIDKPIGDAIGELREAAQETEEISRWSYIFTQFRVITTYIGLLFLPVNQNLDYDYSVYHSFFEPDVFLSFLFLLSIFGLGVYLFYRSRNNPPSPPFSKGGMGGFHGLRLTAFGIFWFFVALSVESSVIPIRDVINEHRLYLPSVGIIIAFTSVIFYGLRFKDSDSRILLTTAYLLLPTVVLTFSIATYQRNTVWKDEVSLWEDVASKSTDKPRGHYNLGRAYYNKGWLDKAITHYQIVLRLNPNDSEAHYNLSVAYNSKGLTDKAIEHYQIALKLNPNDSEAHYNLSVAYNSKGLTDKAIEHYQIALKLNPDYVEAHYNAGLIYLEKGFIDKARREFETVLLINPHDYEARQFLNYISNLNKTDSLEIHQNIKPLSK